jgi:Rap1a immunity proteins
MGNRLFMVAAVTVGVLVAAEGMAESDSSNANTGEQVLTECKQAMNFLDEGSDILQKDNAVADVGLCLGYLSGFRDSHTADSLIINRIKPGLNFYCMPDSVTPGQMARVVVKYLSDHPEVLHKSRPFVVLDSFMKAFPCGQK